MPTQFGVAPENLQSLSAEIRQTAISIEALLGDLSRKVAPIQSDWQGPAHESFEQLWSQWQVGADHVHQALVAISELLGKAGSAYAEAERSIASAFQL
jgi:WXG100 family type VII secretion target